MDKAIIFRGLACLIVFMTAAAATLLGLRQHQIETTHKTVALHRQITQMQFMIWDLEGRVAARLNPGKLRSTLAHVHPDLEPLILDGVPSPHRPTGFAAAAFEHGPVSNP